MDKKIQQALEQELRANPTFQRNYGTNSNIVTDITTVQSFTDTIFPTFTVEQSPILEFNVGSCSTHWLNLASVLLYLKLKIVDGTGATVTAAAKVGPVTNLMSSLFKSMEVYCNGVLINSSSTEHPHASFFRETLFSTKNEQATVLRNQGYFHSNTSTIYSDGNNVAKLERELAVMPCFELIGGFNHDLFRTNTNLPKNTNIRIRVHPSANVFQLLGPVPATGNFAYKVVIEQAFLTVSRSLMHSKLQHIIDA